jgi:hypothetical protein
MGARREESTTAKRATGSRRDPHNCGVDRHHGFHDGYVAIDVLDCQDRPTFQDNRHLFWVLLDISFRSMQDRYHSEPSSPDLVRVVPHDAPIL